MPADPVNIVRAVRRSRVVSLADSSILAAFPGARDAIEDPEPGYFESATDASAALAIKQSLTGVPRRRFTVALAEELEIDPIAGLPLAALTDVATAFTGGVMLCRVQVDLEAETSAVEVLG